MDDQRLDVFPNNQPMWKECSKTDQAIWKEGSKIDQPIKRRL
jgi:hypothetical protein